MGCTDEVTVMDARPIAERQFGNWWMGLRPAFFAAMTPFAAGRLDPTQEVSGEQAVASGARPRHGRGLRHTDRQRRVARTGIEARRWPTRNPIDRA